MPESFRLSKEEIDQVEKESQRLGLGKSEYYRQAVLEKLEGKATSQIEIKEPEQSRPFDTTCIHSGRAGMFICQWIKRGYELKPEMCDERKCPQLKYIFERLKIITTYETKKEIEKKEREVIDLKRNQLSATYSTYEDSWRTLLGKFGIRSKLSKFGYQYVCRSQDCKYKDDPVNQRDLQKYDSGLVFCHGGSLTICDQKMHVDVWLESQIRSLIPANLPYLSDETKEEMK